MITAVPGVSVGHWTAPDGRSGCTVVVFEDAFVASGEVRGGAPGTREWDLLAPERTVEHIDAVVLSGGSAFGLSCCDGVVRWLEQHGRGLPTPHGRVPIVVGAVLYDLGVATVRPGPEAGYAACEAASATVTTGRVGAGAGATVGKWRGPSSVRAGGVGSVSAASEGLVVGALFAVNAYGDLYVPGSPPPSWPGETPGFGREATTIGVVATNAALDKRGCLLVAQSAHDGLARALEPVHTSVDGDAVVAAARRPGTEGAVAAPLEHVRLLAARATEGAVRAALSPLDDRSSERLH